MEPTLTDASPAAARLPEIIKRLRIAHPDATCALDHRNALELLVATILSAQCTDERVNKVTPALFARYPDAQAFAEADREELEQAIHSTGFYRNKAKNIQEACGRIVVTYGGQVPATMEELLTLAGVARKTANVVLGNEFGIADGVVVDTHVKRLSQRLALSKQSDPDKIEKDLMALTPRDEWIDLSNLLIFHGRRVCDAKKPNCAACTISSLCPSATGR
ncbi:MAG: endonuclease III [Anaerolineales bacterium]|nr:endonuclease III [Anaerolineales bacterium]